MTYVTRRNLLALTGAAIAASRTSARAAPTGRGDVTALAPLPYTGVNLAGADFGGLPGKHGREYLYPNAANARYYADLGFNLIRLPFKWERLEPELGNGFEAEEEKRLIEAVTDFTGLGQHLVLNPHNYAKRRIKADGWSREHLIGSQEVPVSAFAEFWTALAQRFAGNERVMFGLMNEPANIGVGDWLEAAQAAVQAIRGTGARNLILVPGVEYSGAHSWSSAGNTRMIDIRDPNNNLVFEVHQYFDADSSGRSPEAVSETIGSKRIKDFQTWARQNKVRAFLGEFNGGRNERSAAALRDVCREMASNPDVWIGWAAWAGGPRWPEDDIFNLEPTKNGIREQTRILAGYAQRA